MPKQPTVLARPRTQLITIHVTQRENDQYFRQKLPTWRNGFCEIKRRVTFVPDPDGIYGENEYGYITVYGKRISVVGSVSTDGTITHMEIEHRQRGK